MPISCKDISSRRSPVTRKRSPPARECRGANNLGLVFYRQGKLDEAVRWCSEALKLMPTCAEAHNNMGTILERQGKLDEALGSYWEAIRYKPGFAEAHSNLANVLWGQGKFDESMQHYEEALRISPEHPDLHWNCSLLRLRRGDFKRGWPQYEWRWLTKAFVRPNFSQPALGWVAVGRADNPVAGRARRGRCDPVHPLCAAGEAARRAGRSPMPHAAGAIAGAR